MHCAQSPRKDGRYGDWRGRVGEGGGGGIEEELGWCVVCSGITSLTACDVGHPQVRAGLPSVRPSCLDSRVGRVCDVVDNTS